jgi:hypothetical protein
MQSVTIPGVYLRLYDEIRKSSERFFRKTLPVFRNPERYRMEVEEREDRYLVYFYELDAPLDPARKHGVGVLVYKKDWRVVHLLPHQLERQ